MYVSPVGKSYEQLLENTPFGREAQFLLEQLPHPVGFAGMDGRALFVNPSFLTLGGFSKDEILNRRLYDFCLDQSHPGYCGIVGQMHKRYLERLAGQDELYAMPFVGTDQVTRDVELYGAPLRASDGSVVGSFGFLQDVTQRRGLERKLAEMLSKPYPGPEFDQMLAHDLRNCMTVINGRAALLANSRISSDSAPTHAAAFTDAAMFAAELLQRGLSARENRKGSGNVNPFLVCQDMVASIKAIAGHRICVTGDIKFEDAVIQLTGYELSQLILNLVFNAVEAISGYGTLGLSCKLVVVASDRRLGSQILTAGSYVLLEIRDSGAGINRELFGKIFEREFSTKSTGSGLGLWSVLNHVRSSKGLLDVSSYPGAGSNFAVWFPVVSELD